MSAGDLILPAPAWRAGRFAQASEALVRMDLYQQKRGNCVSPATTAANGKLRLERHLDWYGFNAGDFQRIRLEFSPLCKGIHKGSHVRYYPLQEPFSLLGGGQIGMSNRPTLGHLVKLVYKIDWPPVQHIRLSIAVRVAWSVPPGQRQLHAARAQVKHDRGFHLTCMAQDRKSTRLNSSHLGISYAV